MLADGLAHSGPQSDGSIGKHKGKESERGDCGELASAAESWFVHAVEQILLKAQITRLWVVVLSWAGGQSWNSADTHLFMQKGNSTNTHLFMPRKNPSVTTALVPFFPAND